MKFNKKKILLKLYFAVPKQVPVDFLVFTFKLFDQCYTTLKDYLFFKFV